MKETQKRTKRPKSALTAFVGLLICSTAITSCGGEAFPAKFILEVDTKAMVCGKYKIVDPENLKFEHVEDLPLEACNGVFGFATRDVPKVLRWSRAKIKESCN